LQLSETDRVHDNNDPGQMQLGTIYIGCGLNHTPEMALDAQAATAKEHSEISLFRDEGRRDLQANLQRINNVFA